MRKSDIKRLERALSLLQQAKETLNDTLLDAYMQDMEYVQPEISVRTFLRAEIKDINVDITILSFAIKKIKENHQ